MGGVTMGMESILSTSYKEVKMQRLLRGISTKYVPFANIAAAMPWSLWCACVQSFLVLLEGTDTICRQSKHVYALSYVFTMFKKIEKSTAFEMQSVIYFLNARNMKPADMPCKLCELYGKHAMSDSIMRWVSHCNGRENVLDKPLNRSSSPWNGGTHHRQ
jgi:hypothetical protein